jgi:hypothetical protein
MPNESINIDGIEYCSVCEWPFDGNGGFTCKCNEVNQ